MPSRLQPTPRQAAQSAVDAQQSAVASMGAQREALIKELAKAQNISVALAAERQAGLEERQRQRLAEQRRQEALPRCEQQQTAAAGTTQCAHRRTTGGSNDNEPNNPRPNNPKPNNPKPNNPDASPKPPATSPNPPAPSGGAAAAIRFARAQLGEPYVWGAAGPSSWDCSGLTMGAWAAAGVYLPHYSVAQYAATTPISYSQLKPGDLIYLGQQPERPGHDLPRRALHRRRADDPRSADRTGRPDPGCLVLGVAGLLRSPLKHQLCDSVAQRHIPTVWKSPPAAVAP